MSATPLTKLPQTQPQAVGPFFFARQSCLTLQPEKIRRKAGATDSPHPLTFPAPAAAPKNLYTFNDFDAQPAFT